MGTTTRHFNALMRKNLINWKRDPCAAVCQVLCPGLLMLVICYIRTRISASTFSADYLQLLQTPMYTAIFDTNGTVDVQATNAKVNAFFNYNNYTWPTGGVYLSDLYPYSPLTFNPSNCLQNSSFVLPKVASPYIAIVGQNNSAQTRVNDYIQALQDYWQINEVNNLTLKAFDTIEDFNSYVSSETYLYPDLGVCFGYQIVQNSDSSYSVSLLFDDQQQFGGSVAAGLPASNLPAWTPTASNPDIGAFNQSIQYGYSFIQNVIANALLQEATNSNTSSIDMMAVPIPSNKIIVDQFETVLSGIFPLFLLLVYILPVYNITQAIVKEKESKAKESMRMMGLTDFPYWLSWFAYFTMINTSISLIGWLCLCINVIEYSSKLYILMYMWLFGQSIFGQIVFYQSLFTRSKYAGIVGALIYFGGSLANVPVASVSSSRTAKTIASIIPQVASSQLAVVWANFETSEVGISSQTAHDVYGNYTFDEGLWMFLVGFLVFLLLGLYLDQVLPKEFGQRRHPCFMFMPSTYTGCCSRRQVPEVDDEEKERRSTLLSKEKNGGGMEVRNLDPRFYEPVAVEIARQEVEGQYLRIENLEKTYDNGFQAVGGLNLKIYQNQIFALLGQNGAGKSTTISMLTGLIPSSKGSATVLNLDMFEQAEQVRQFMGVCPQHDVLFDTLTPEEHLSVFYDFKGGPPEQKEKEIEDLIRDVGLTQDRKKQASSLSGGNKRKLSVAIALCGGSKLVLLDEPTAGMDLGARRGLWDMLKNYRRDKIIILTTHYMDEADVLGDRIGIMAKGKMMCLGTSLFLKNKFGAGYKLTMVKTNKQTNLVIGPYLKKHLGEVELLSEVSSEITFQVSTESAKKFKQFFQTFDQELFSLGITSYGVSITTLEEVFLKINKQFNINIGNAALEDRLTQQRGYLEGDIPEAETSPDEQNANESRASTTSLNKKLQLSGEQNIIQVDQEINNGEELERLVGQQTIFSTVGALLVKRFHIYKRDKTGICCELLVPVIMVFIGCLLTKISISKPSVSTLIQPSLYPIPQRILMNQNNVITTASDISPQTLFQNLPNSASDFQVTYSPTQNFTIFDQQVYDQRNDGSETPYRYGSYQIYQASLATNTYQVSCYINLTSPMVTEYYPQFIYESILKSATGNPNFQFSVTTVPFPTFYQLNSRSQETSAFNFSFMVSIAVALIPCVMISFILREREDSLKHIQLISGMSLPAYWISNIIADLIKVYIPIILMILLSKIFKVNYKDVWVLFLLLPLAIVPFSYATSFLFKNDTTAQIITLFVNFFVCAVMGPVVYFLQLVPTTFKLGGILRWTFCLIPNYCLINGILWSSSKAGILTVRQANANYKQLPSNNWAWQNLGGDAAFLVAHCVLGILILVFIEADLLNCFKEYTLRQVPPKLVDQILDDDVLLEEQRVQQNSTDVIRVSNFRKAYTNLLGQPFLAVERISFGLDYGECFALLGVNGAGKSTTFKSLTADTSPTEGEITIDGHNIQTQFSEARKLIGYCPQKDAIFPLMTVEEHLVFYAKIKGIPLNLQAQIVEQAITELNLSDHRTKPAGTLSGGNKRKLSVAMATIGNPPIILLDEPSAGMDPEARRFMWSVVANISQRDKKSAVILTTHSMEEAEALSTKMGIMVRGGIFKCFGSSQHIKNKFGTGYEIEIKIRKPQFSELEKLAQDLQFVQSIEQRIDLNEAKQQCLRANVNPLIIEQIKGQSLGSDLQMEADQSLNNTIRMKNLVTYVYTQQMGLQVINLIASQFEQVDLIEQCSDFFKFRVPRENKTIGYLFGLIEDSKLELNISEYSVSSTTLEQIFQAFANQSIDNKASLSFSLNANGQLQAFVSQGISRNTDKIEIV